MLGGVCSSGSVDSLFTSAFKFFAASQCLLREPWPNTATIDNGSHFDFIIVGAGTAGATLAARLAQVPDFTVLLVEAGGYPPQEAIVPGFRDTLKASPYDWNFTTVNDLFTSQGLKNGRQVQPRGKMLGGSNSINDMVYARGRPEDYEEWADIVGNTWNWTNVLDYFKKTERVTDERIINNDDLMYYHGTEGEIEVSGRVDINEDIKKILEGFEELGVPIVDDLTNPSYIGAGVFSHTISNGRRASSVTAMLNRVRTDNLFVLTNTFAKKILIDESGKAVGIKALMNEEVFEFYADKEIIVSAGTFNTPKLLMLSGIGPKDHLESLGIPVIQDLPVGKNLHDHIMVINYLVINNGTCAVNDTFQYFQMMKYLYDSSGIFSYSDSAGVYLPKAGEDPNIPYFSIYPTCVPQSGITLAGCMNILGYDEEVCQKITDANEKHELISLAVVHLKPQSRGAVLLDSTDPLRSPLIYSGNFKNDTDFDGYLEAINFAFSLANTKYFKAQNARVLDYSWDKCKNSDSKRCLIQDYAMPAWHAVGTTAMGTVVNAHLQVLGIKNLRVVDAGVMPTIIRGNTNAVVIMIAEKAADFIKSAHGISL